MSKEIVPAVALENNSLVPMNCDAGSAPHQTFPASTSRSKAVVNPHETAVAAAMLTASLPMPILDLLSRDNLIEELSALHASLGKNFQAGPSPCILSPFTTSQALISPRLRLYLNAFAHTKLDPRKLSSPLD